MAAPHFDFFMIASVVFVLCFFINSQIMFSICEFILCSSSIQLLSLFYFFIIAFTCFSSLSFSLLCPQHAPPQKKVLLKFKNLINKLLVFFPVDHGSWRLRCMLMVYEEFIHLAKWSNTLYMQFAFLLVCLFLSEKETAKYYWNQKAPDFCIFH